MTLLTDTCAKQVESVLRNEVVEYDLNQTAQQLRYLRFAEYFLAFFGLSLIVDAAAFVVAGFTHGVTDAVFVVVFIDVALISVGIVAFRNCAKFREDIWKRYRLLFPLAGLGVLSRGAISLLTVFALWGSDSFSGNFGIIGSVQLILVCALGVIAIAVGMKGLKRLRTSKLLPTKYSVVDLIGLSDAIRRIESPDRMLGRPISRWRGNCLFALGLIVVAVGGAGTLLSFFGFFLLIKSRQYLQVSTDSLLTKDTRRPILFLRAFADDARTPIEFSLAQLVKVFDFSVETRLANYFMNFGPFIAVGSPQEHVPVPGAARVRLSDEEWQQWITERMNTSSIVLMYASVSHWVGWELSKVVEAKLENKLILLFSNRLMPRFADEFKNDMRTRLEAIKATLAETRWVAALQKVDCPETLLAMRFHETGGLTVFRSKQRTNDAFHIAVEIAHLAALGPLPPQLDGF